MMEREKGRVVRRAMGVVSAAGAWACVLAIRGYQVTVGPLLAGHCRFDPTCSVYAIEAYRVHGVIRGTWLTARRLARCHPFGGCGHDPVPEKRGGGEG